MANLKQQRVEKSLVALANATELASSIITEIAGNDISNSINGSTITRNAARTLIQSRFKQALERSEVSPV